MNVNVLLSHNEKKISTKSLSTLFTSVFLCHSVIHYAV